MEREKIISGNDVDEVWQHVTRDLGDNKDLLNYSVILNQQNRKVMLDIDIDPGGGFESGDETTVMSSKLQNTGSLKFAMHHQGFIDEIGKFFGMQDVVTGYEYLDKKVIIKPNDEAKVRSIFTDDDVRKVFQDLDNFNFHIVHHANTGTKGQDNFLELYLHDGITDPGYLRKIHAAFFSVLISLDA